MAERGVAVPPSGVTLGAALGFAESAVVDAAASTIRSVAARLSESGVVGDDFKRAAQKHAAASGDGTGPRAPSASEATSLSSDSIDTLDSRVASLVAVLASEKIESLGFSVPDDMPLLESVDQQQDVVGARLRGTLLRLENAFVHNSLIALEEKGVCVPREDVLREDPSAAPCMSMRGLKAATEQSLVALAKQALEASGPAEGARSLQGMSQNDLLRAAADALVQAALDGGDAFASLPPVVKHAAKAGGEALLRAAASPEGVEAFLATVGPSDLSSLLEMAVQKGKAAAGEEGDDAQAHATELVRARCVRARPRERGRRRDGVARSLRLTPLPIAFARTGTRPHVFHRRGCQGPKGGRAGRCRDFAGVERGRARSRSRGRARYDRFETAATGARRGRHRAHGTLRPVVDRVPMRPARQRARAFPQFQFAVIQTAQAGSSSPLDTPAPPAPAKVFLGCTPVSSSKTMDDLGKNPVEPGERTPKKRPPPGTLLRSFLSGFA